MSGSPVRPGDRRASMLGAPVTNTTSVKVVVRIRPTTSADATSVPQRFQRIAVQPLSETTLQADNPSPSASGAGKHAKQVFTFDRVVGPDEGQPAVYDSATQLIDAYLDGFNATILAYGQTSSGKSYTMGTDQMREGVLEDLDRQGITPRAVTEIFNRLDHAQQTSDGRMTFTAKVSYVEIYNEDLIDLLAGDAGVRPTVQIREDKQGRIFWSGLREVKVTSASDVMNLLASGSALRQTGATDMNAQSSRSHAIFSLTVTQQRWTGTGAPTAPATPGTPTSPSHNRRASALPRISSPTPATRPGTPSSERPASRFGLRPPSTGGRPSSPQGDDLGTWTNVTSKFHFVDLAGSERLKRTAAAGDRAKEGISINAGLSALGNVISALGDPTKKATHIPYRDSKLTRLLQDSLGGNARTMMVACISPAEFNLHETLSTLKYANRARNIKNRAEINETESGWDDLVYLQRTITKLRAELAAVKAGDPAGLSTHDDRTDSATGDVFDASLQQRVSTLTAELAKAQAASSPASDHPATSLSRDQFAAAVEPIVEEYERSLSALESQLALTRAALGHSEEEMHELENRIDEEFRSNQANEALIEELRVRVAKLSERETTTEAYVRDIETKLKEVDEVGEANGTAMSDLRKELAKSRAQTQSTELYIKELEARLAQADTTTAALRRQIETLEQDIVAREEAHRELEARVALLDNRSETKLLIAEIDEKDRRLSELERSLDELKGAAQAAREDVTRLQKLADAERSEKEDLLGRVRTLERSNPRQPAGTPTRPRSTENDPSAPDATETASTDARDSAESDHAETLRELEEARRKYRDALKEIEDLHGQAEEARLLRTQYSGSPGGGDDAPIATGEDPTAHVLSDREAPRTPTAPRSVPPSPTGQSFLGRGQGASSPSYLRCASLQQELSSAASSQTSCPPSPGSTSPLATSPARRDSLFAPTGRSYEQLQSEVNRLQAALDERDEEIVCLEATIQQQANTPATTPSLGDSPIVSFSPVMQRPVTPTSALDASEVEVLSPRIRAKFDSLRDDFAGKGLGIVSPDLPETARSTRDRIDELMLSMAAKERAHREQVEKLDAELASMRRKADEMQALSRDQAENMTVEISGLRAELAARPTNEAHENELARLHKDHDARIAAAASTAEDQRLRAVEASEAHVASLEELHETTIVELRHEHAQQVDVLVAEKEQMEASLTAVSAAHEDEVRALQFRLDDFEEVQRQAKLAKEDTTRLHESVLRELAEKHTAATLEKDGQHSAIIDSLRKDHEKQLAGLREERDAAAVLLEQQRQHEIVTLHKSHVDELTAAQAATSDREAQLQQLKQQFANAAEEHRAAVESARQAHDEELQQKIASATAVAEESMRGELLSAQNELTRLTQDHERLLAEEKARVAELEFRLQELAAESELAQQDLERARTAAAENLLDAQRHANVELEDVQLAHANELAKVKAAMQTEHEASAAALRQQIDDASAEHARRLELLDAEQKEAIGSMKAEHAQTRDAAEVEHAQALEAVKEQHAKELSALQRTFMDRIETLTTTHREELARMETAHAAKLASVLEDHAGQQDRVRVEHDTAREAHEFETQTLRAALDELSARLDGVEVELQSKQSALASTGDERDQLAMRLDDVTQQLADATESYEQGISALQQKLRFQQHVSANSSGSSHRHEALAVLDTLNGSLVSPADSVDGGEPNESSRELGRIRELVTKLDTDLALALKERDGLAQQLARMSLSSASAAAAIGPSLSRPMSPVGGLDEKLPLNLRAEKFLSNANRLPPPVPPPTMPPPPVPSAASVVAARSGGSHASNSTVSEQSASHAVAPANPVVTQETEALLAQLQKDLAQKEADLQAQRNLANSLESALSDSERNLRKARQLTNDYARERDELRETSDRLKREAEEAHSASESYRQSMLDMEERLAEQRRREARAERARIELESRMSEVAKRKSKFACF